MEGERVSVSRSESTFRVPGMSCMHCVQAIKSALGQLNGVSKVDVDLRAKKVSVSYNPAAVAPDVLAKALEAAGYPAVPA